jgi:hypothetical protein
LQKPKYLFLLNSKFYFLILALVFSFQLYSFELSKNDLPYFQALSIENQSNAEFKDRLIYSAIYGSNAVRLEAALELSNGELSKSGKEFIDYQVVIRVNTALLDDGYTDVVLLEYLLDSYYLSEDYDGLISAVSRYIHGGTGNLSPKIDYYKFTAELFKNGDLISDLYLNLLLQTESSQLIMDASKHIRNAGIVLPGFISLLGDFKTQLYLKEYSSAGRTMINLLQIQKDIIIKTLEKGYIVDNVMLSPVILDEMYKTASAAGRRVEFLGLIEKILLLPERTGYEPGEVYSYELIAGLYETSGYLIRKAGNYSLAAESFYNALPYTNGPKYEKMLWYWYNSLVRSSPYEAITKIELLLGLWTDPDYFNDIFNELATVFVKNEQWRIIKDILEYIQYSGPLDSVSKYAYLTARAGMESYINIERTEINRLFKLAFDSAYGLASGLYYRILAGVHLEIPNSQWIFNDTAASQPLTVKEEADGSFDLLYGLVEYDQIMKSYKYLMENPFSDFTLVRRVAEKLNEDRKYAESIRLLSLYSRFEGFELNIHDLLLIYPDAYRDEIVKISEEEELEWYVFSALVREESHFQHKVVSSAGAIGLSQLMPSTAADVAERLHVSSYNLEDAQTNLGFGGWYLGNLVKRTDVLSDALFAYNGGLTRVRRWRGEYSDLPDDLFLEVIPFKETSHYGRKVLVSSVIYGYLYEDVRPRDIINNFYRN